MIAVIRLPNGIELTLLPTVVSKVRVREVGVNAGVLVDAVSVKAVLLVIGGKLVKGSSSSVMRIPRDVCTTELELPNMVMGRLEVNIVGEKTSKLVESKSNGAVSSVELGIGEGEGVLASRTEKDGSILVLGRSIDPKACRELAEGSGDVWTGCGGEVGRGKLEITEVEEGGWTVVGCMA